MALITLNDIVNAYMEQAKSPQHDKARLITIAVRGIKELNYDVTQQIKCAEFELDPATNSIDYPKDYVKYTKIGICINGNLITLGLNENICTCREYNECGDLSTFVGGWLSGVSQLDSPGNLQGWGGYWFYGSGGYTQFGHGGGFSGLGYYKDDPTNHRILFSSDVGFGLDANGNPTTTPPLITMEYLTNGYVEGEETLIDELAMEAMIAWIRWKDVGFDPQYIRVAESLKMEYGRTRKHLQLRTRSFSEAEFIQASRRGYKSTPKN